MSWQKQWDVRGGIDTVTAKIDIIMKSQAVNIPVISCMGAGDKMDPTKYKWQIYVLVILKLTKNQLYFARF